MSDGEDSPYFREVVRTVDTIEQYTRGLVGSNATIVRRRQGGLLALMLDIAPTNPFSCAIFVLAEQELNITVSRARRSAQIELSYSGEDAAIALKVIAATVAGRVSERRAIGRSTVTFTFDDGQSKSLTSYGYLSLFIPQPGWKRWGRVVNFAPYVYPVADH
ncbi:hypothetical protein [Rhodoglobus aureus]|uniref:Uncharacterized protein n=1 Tax=Rhodoglobus aureus TaxID=191497 RepID=A0ABN1VZ66_9MICO